MCQIRIQLAGFGSMDKTTAIRPAD